MDKYQLAYNLYQHQNNTMEPTSLIVPKEVAFTSVNGVQKLTIQNPTLTKFAVKIRTNHKTALHILPTHDFIEPKSKKDVIVKLMEVHNGVKLQVNYAIATEDMVAKNDSKLTNVDKKDIKKQITFINVSGVKAIPQTKPKEIPVVQTDELNSSFMSVAPQKIEPTKTLEKKISLNLPKQSSTMIVVEQRLQEDQEQFEEKVKKLKSELAQIESKIQTKRESILSRRQELSVAADSNSYLPSFTLPIFIIVAFLLGSLIKSILF